MNFSLVAAIARNHTIGFQQQLPWHIPGELAHFKAITLGHPVLMGAKTFASIGNALSGRKNIILSNSIKSEPEGCIVINNIDDIAQHTSLDDEIMVIGGAEIYQQFIPKASRMYLTLIHHDFKGDVFFPNWSDNDWKETERICHFKSSGHPYDFDYVKYEKIPS